MGTGFLYGQGGTSGSGDLKFLIEGTTATPTLPSDLISIRNFAFYYYTNLAITSLPSSVTSIGQNAFYYCTNLALTSLPSSVTSISQNAFCNCTKLIKLKCWCTWLGSASFKSCTGLTKIWIPSACATIAASVVNDSPFYGCTNVVIYTNASSKLAGWSTYWNYTGDSTQATVNYNITEAQFDAL